MSELEDSLVYIVNFQPARAASLDPVSERWGGVSEGVVIKMVVCLECVLGVITVKGGSCLFRSVTLKDKLSAAPLPLFTLLSDRVLSGNRPSMGRKLGVGEV